MELGSSDFFLWYFIWYWSFGEFLGASIGGDISGGETSDGREIITYSAAIGAKADMPIEWHSSITKSVTISGREVIESVKKEIQNEWNNLIGSIIDYNIQYMQIYLLYKNQVLHLIRCRIWLLNIGYIFF